MQRFCLKVHFRKLFYRKNERPVSLTQVDFSCLSLGKVINFEDSTHKNIIQTKNMRNLCTNITKNTLQKLIKLFSNKYPYETCI